MDALAVVVGKGDSPGIHSASYDLVIPGASLNDDVKEISPAVHAMSKKWALLNQNVLPESNDRFVVKISRHRDDLGLIWTWIGLYKGAVFLGEHRGGHYVGVGIAFLGRISTFGLFNALEVFLNGFMRDSAQEGVVKGSVARWHPREGDFAVLGNLRIERLSKAYAIDGIQPGLGKSRQISCFPWSNEELDRLIKEALIGKNYQSNSCVFITSWNTPGENRDVYDAGTTEDVVIGNRHVKMVASGVLQTEVGSDRPVGVRSEGRGDTTLSGSRLSDAERRIEVLEHLLKEAKRESHDLRKYIPSGIYWLLIGLILIALVQTLEVVLLMNLLNGSSFFGVK